MRTLSGGVLAVVTLGVAGLGCTHRTGLSPVDGATDAGREGTDVGSDATAGGSDAAIATSIVGTCATVDDCVPVLDYRAGFACWVPSAASLADISRDPCLIPWKPNPRCTTEAPPASCPGGPQPVQHSCFNLACAIPACTAGRCSINLGFGDQCGPANKDAAPIDCEALRTTLVNTLAAAQQCDPTQSPPSCQGDYADTCGCEAPYDLFGPYANAVQCAFEAWSDAHCPLAACGRPCLTPTKAGAACVPNATGTTGTCAWK
jgi:hypothetical protein